MDSAASRADSAQAHHHETEAERQVRIAWEAEGIAETEAERQDRFALEAEGIAEARADVATGRLVDAAKVRAWVDGLRTDSPLPVPYSGRSRAARAAHAQLHRKTLPRPA